MYESYVDYIAHIFNIPGRNPVKFPIKVRSQRSATFSSAVNHRRSTTSGLNRLILRLVPFLLQNSDCVQTKRNNNNRRHLPKHLFIDCMEIGDTIYYLLVLLVALPVKLFFDLWSWLGWELFINN